MKARSRTKAATSLTPKVKRTPKRKAKKTPKKTELQISNTEDKLSVKDSIKSADKALGESLPLQVSLHEEGKAKAKDLDTLPLEITEDTKETPNKKTTVNSGKTTNKNTKKKKIIKTGNKKDVKKPEPKGKKSEEERTDPKQEEKEKELEIKVKELEKLVKAPTLDTEKAILETTTENTAGKSPISNRKRKNSDSSLKDKPRKTKIKQEVCFI